MWAWSLLSIWKKLPKSQRLGAKCSVIQRGMSHSEPVNRPVFHKLQFYLHLVLFYMCTLNLPHLFLSPLSSFPNQKHQLRNSLLSLPSLLRQEVVAADSWAPVLRLSPPSWWPADDWVLWACMHPRKPETFAEVHIRSAEWKTTM